MFEWGFKNEMDKCNMVIYEFVYFIDKLDGDVDGFLVVLM